MPPLDVDLPDDDGSDDLRDNEAEAEEALPALVDLLRSKWSTRRSPPGIDSPALPDLDDDDDVLGLWGLPDLLPDDKCAVGLLGVVGLLGAVGPLDSVGTRVAPPLVVGFVVGFAVGPAVGAPVALAVGALVVGAPVTGLCVVGRGDVVAAAGAGVGDHPPPPVGGLDGVPPPPA